MHLLQTFGQGRETKYKLSDKFYDTEEDINIGGKEVSFGGSDFNIGGKEVSFGGSDFSIGGKEVSFGGSDFSIGGKEVSFGGSDFNIGGSKLNLKVETSNSQLIEIAERARDTKRLSKMVFAIACFRYQFPQYSQLINSYLVMVNGSKF